MDAETALVDFASALEVDATLREEAAQREAEERAEAERKEREALLDQLRTKEGKEKLYAQLTMELQKPPEQPPQKGERPLNVRDSNLPPAATHKCPQPRPCSACKTSGDVCRGGPNRACTACALKHAVCTLSRL